MFPKGHKFGPFEGRPVNASEIKTGDGNDHMWEVIKPTYGIFSAKSETKILSDLCVYLALILNLASGEAMAR